MDPSLSFSSLLRLFRFFDLSLSRFSPSNLNIFVIKFNFSLLQHLFMHSIVKLPKFAIIMMVEYFQ